MKNVLIAVFTLISLASLAQNKKDNTILIKGDISPDKINTVLFNNGYKIEHSDNIYNATKSLKSFELRLSILRTDTMLTLKGTMKMSVSIQTTHIISEPATYEVYFGGMKSSPLKDAWNEMDKIAKLLGEHIIYVKQ